MKTYILEEPTPESTRSLFEKTWKDRRRSKKHERNLGFLKNIALLKSAEARHALILNQLLILLGVGFIGFLGALLSWWWWLLWFPWVALQLRWQSYCIQFYERRLFQTFNDEVGAYAYQAGYIEGHSWGYSQAKAQYDPEEDLWYIPGEEE